jgi:hypothetical protein
MPTTEASVLHQQALTVTGLLTGLTLTALILIPNSPHSFRVAIGPLSGEQYFETLVTYVALLGVLSGVAMLSFFEIAGGLAQTLTPLDTMGTTFFLVTVFGFMGVLPLLLLPYTPIGAGIVLGGVLVLVSTYFVVRRLPPGDGAHP